MSSKIWRIKVGAHANSNGEQEYIGDAIMQQILQNMAIEDYINSRWPTVTEFTIHFIEGDWQLHSHKEKGWRGV